MPTAEKLRRRALVRFLLSAALVLLCLFLLQRLVTPKYAGDIVEGALISEYYAEAKDHDLIFIGDCEVYENFSPKVLWEEYGVNSFIRGSAQQLIWQSYYLLEETLHYETPRAVVFNVLALQYNEPQREAYNRMTLDGMRWSGSKLKSILASMTEEESLVEYLFPLLRYHTRWSELTPEDAEYLFKDYRPSHNGFLMRVDVRPAENVPEGRILADYSFGDRAWSYLEKMRLLCEEKGVQLILVKAPSLYPYWYPQWEEQVEDYAAEHGLLYINYLDLIDETGLDFSTDTYDAGLHLNLSGAEKISRHLGQLLREDLGFPDRRGEEPLSSRWQEKLAAYEAERESQLAALGKI